MAEITQQMLLNGQELQNADVTALGLAALMDDRVLAEVLRMLPNTGTVARLILPYGQDNDSASGTVATFQSADAKVYVLPFRAVVGSRTAVGTDSLKSWRDIRSGVFVGGGGVWSSPPITAGLSVAQVVAANSSGNARWDLLYAVIAPDANLAAVVRAQRSPTTGVVTTPSTVTQLASIVSLGYLQGAPSASPALPAIPADSGGNYYIPLAYVMVPNGFSATSVVKPWMILSAHPSPIALSKGLGGVNCTPANELNKVGGQIVQSTSEASWANNSTVSTSARPNVFMPPGMIGSEMIFGGFDLTGGSSAAWSHQSLANVDSSRDWRNRHFLVFWMAQQQTSSGGHFAWDHGADTTKFIPTWSPDAAKTHPVAGYQFFGFGQSFLIDGANLPGAPPANASVASFVSNSQLSLFDAGAAGASLALYVDQATGNLKVFINGTTATCLLWFWLFSSRPYGNY